MTRSVPHVVLVGRINAGKSTLYNKLTEQFSAIVSDVPGTTRDINETLMHWRHATFALVDTGGLDAASLGMVEKKVQEQAFRAVKSATLILYVIDGKGDVTAIDRTLARSLRQGTTPVILVATKLDGPRWRRRVSPQLYSLGLGDPHLVSGTSGVGTGDLLDAIVERLPAKAFRARTSELFISIVGKTNVGKSSLFNALIGEERAIVTPIPHTTRDPHDVILTYHGTPLTIVDTAGLRRDRKQSSAIEHVSSMKTKQMIDRSDLCWLVTDVSEPLSVQDQIIAQHALDAHNSIIIVANKWDRIANKTPLSIPEHTKRYRNFFAALGWAPILFVSATEKQRLGQLLKLTIAVASGRKRTLTPQQLKSMLTISPPKKAAPRKGTKSAADLRLKQTRANPPVFTLATRHPDRIHPAYCNFLERLLRQRYDFTGTPIQVQLQKN